MKASFDLLKFFVNFLKQKLKKSEDDLEFKPRIIVSNTKKMIKCLNMFEFFSQVSKPEKEIIITLGNK